MIGGSVDGKGEGPGIGDWLDSLLCNVAIIFANSTNEHLADF